MKFANSRLAFRAAFCALLIPLFSGNFTPAQAVPHTSPAAETLPVPEGSSGASEMTSEEMLSLGLKQLEDKLYFSAIESLSNCLEKKMPKTFAR